MKERKEHKGETAREERQGWRKNRMDGRMEWKGQIKQQIELGKKKKPMEGKE